MKTIKKMVLLLVVMANVGTVVYAGCGAKAYCGTNLMNTGEVSCTGEDCSSGPGWVQCDGKTHKCKLLPPKPE